MPFSTLLSGNGAQMYSSKFVFPGIFDFELGERCVASKFVSKIAEMNL